jgi:Kdo2-lipid IVA lauroyltransferase/acyltransferase
MVDRKDQLMKHIRYLLETICVCFLFAFFLLLPWRVASGLGAWTAWQVGRFTRLQKKAMYQIHDRLPDLDAKAISRQVWSNMGRVAAEFPHVYSWKRDYFLQQVEISGLACFDAAMHAQRPVIVFSGHFANWEIAPLIAFHFGHPVALVYRPANNPYVERIFQYIRQRRIKRYLPKGSDGARAIISALKKNEPIGMLLDQKFNKGLAIPFLGKEAMTAPAIAEFAIRYQAILLPVQTIRKEDNRYQVIFQQPLEIENKTVEEILIDVNQLLGKWVLEHPEQWFWLHQRWGKL